MDKPQLDKILRRADAEGEKTAKIDVNPNEGMGLTGQGLSRNSKTGNLQTTRPDGGKTDIGLDKSLPDGQYRTNLEDGRSAVRKI